MTLSTSDVEIADVADAEDLSCSKPGEPVTEARARRLWQLHIGCRARVCAAKFYGVAALVERGKVRLDADRWSEP